MRDLTSHIKCTDEFIGRGGFGCVYKGRWVEEAMNATQPRIVVKVMNPSTGEKQEKRQSKQIKRELDLWSKIKHKNILPLLGIAHINPDANIPAFICTWMENGNAKQFCSRYPTFSPLRILYGIIQGLHYLHTFEPEIVHGDIKAVNVLINDECEACLCDFGLSRFLIDNTLWRTTATQSGGSLPWMSPELMTGKQIMPSKESDIYAFAMTCYEIVSGNVPFNSVRIDATLIYNVTVEKQRPQQVESWGLDVMWDIIIKCWAEKPEDRPHTAEVLELVRNITPLGRDPLFFSIGQIHLSAHANVAESSYNTPSAETLGELDERTVSTDRRYLSISKILETEDEQIGEGSLMERYLNVSKVLEN